MTNGSETAHGATSVAYGAQNMGLLRDLRLGAARLSRRDDRDDGGAVSVGPVDDSSRLDFSALMKDARYISLSTIVTNVILVAFLIVVARMVPWTAKDYLAMTWPSRQEVSIALASLVILLPGLDALAYLVGQPIIPSFVVDVYQSAQSQGSMLLLWLAIVIAAPVAEEIIFRGFIFRGWVRPTQRPMLGILIVTLLFTIIHIQYNWFGLLQVFMIGLLLTWTRWRSGSTLLPMVMHVIANF